MSTEGFFENVGVHLIHPPKGSVQASRRALRWPLPLRGTAGVSSISTGLAGAGLSGDSGDSGDSGENVDSGICRGKGI